MILVEGAKYSLAESKQKIEAYCAYQERCDHEIRQKLHSWRLNSAHIDELIDGLIKDGFLNEERFASAFASGKFRIKKWGRNKIKAKLREKKLPNYLIDKALKGINEDDYFETALQLARLKLDQQKSGSSWEKMIKIKRYLEAKGYESAVIGKCMENLYI